MPRFRIVNRTSCADFGEWIAVDELDALRQVAEMGDCVLADESNADEVEGADSVRESENRDGYVAVAMTNVAAEVADG
jgi:hypothetical protein